MTVKWTRLLTAICFISTQANWVPLFGRDRDLVFYQPQQVRPYQPDYQQQYNPRLNDLNSFIPKIQFSAIPDLNIGIATARIPKFDVRDIDDSIWSYNFEPIKFAERRVTSFQATVDLPTNHQVSVDMKDIAYVDKNLTPVKLTETHRDTYGQSLAKTRQNQTATLNPSFQKYQEYVRQNYPDLLTHPLQEKPAGLSPQPSKELVDGFEENWVFKGDRKAGEPKTVNFVVGSIGYAQGRYLNHYEGSIHKGSERLTFNADAPRGTQGEIEAIKIHIEAKGTPTVDITWNPKNTENPSQSFELLRNNLPVPLLVGFRSGVRLNDVDLPQAPLKVTPDGQLSGSQLGSSNDIINLMGKSDLGLEVNFSAPTKENQKSDFSLKNGLRNLWYMVSGKLGEVKAMRSQLTAMRDSEPTKFFLAAGLNDPSFMSLKDLRSALKDIKPMSTFKLPDGSILNGQLNIKGGELQSVQPGTIRTVSSNSNPVEINGVKWHQGSFISDGSTYHLKGEGKFSTNEFMNYTLVDSSIKVSVVGDGRGALQTLNIEPLKPNTLLRDNASGLTMQVQKDGTLDFTSNQTGILNIQGSESKIEINDVGKLKSPVDIPLTVGNQIQNFHVTDLKPNINTGGWDMNGQVELKDNQALSVRIPNANGVKISSLKNSATGNLAPATQAHIRQEDDHYVLSNGRVGALVTTSFNGEVGQEVLGFQAMIGAGSELTVTGKTEFPQYGLTVIAGQIRLESNGVNLKTGTIYQDKTGTYFFNEGIGQISPVTVDGDKFTASVKEIKLIEGKTLNFQDLRLDGQIDFGNGKANLTNTAYQVDAYQGNGSNQSSEKVAVFIRDNGIQSIQVIPQNKGIPQPDQSYHVDSGVVANTYFYAQDGMLNPSNTFLQKVVFGGLQFAVFPLALAEEFVGTYSLNAFYFSSQGGQYLARAKLQPSWRDKLNDGLNAAAMFANAAFAIAPIKALGVSAATSISAFAETKMQGGLALRLNPMNYTVEARGLGSNLGNVELKFSPRLSSTKLVGGESSQLEFNFTKNLPHAKGESGLVIGRGGELKRYFSKSGLPEGEYRLGWFDVRDNLGFEANWAKNQELLLNQMKMGKPIRDITEPLVTNAPYLVRERSLLVSNGWSQQADGFWYPPRSNR